MPELKFGLDQAKDAGDTEFTSLTNQIAVFVLI